MGSFLIEKNYDDGSDYELEGIYFVDKSSMWLVDGQLHVPSVDVKLRKKLSPGIYRIETRMDKGVCAVKLENNSDELFDLNSDIIQSVMKEISAFWDKKELFESKKLLHKRGILLEGAPGNGKTSLITLLSQKIIEIGGVVFLVEKPQDLNLYINFLWNDFRHIEPDTPIITIIEDLDKYTETHTLLDFLDGKTSIEHHVIVFTSNNTEDIPDPFLRPSRIDLRVVIDFPCEDDIKQYFTLKGVQESDLEVLADKAKGLSMADLKELYISVYILGYSIDESIQRITAPIKRANYTFNSKKRKSISHF